MIQIFLKVFTDSHFTGAFLQTVIILSSGYFFTRYNIIAHEGKAAITAIVWKLAVPCLAFNAFMQDFDLNSFKLCIVEFFVAAFLYALLYWVGKVTFLGKGSDLAVVAALFFAVGQTTLFSMPVLLHVYDGHSDEVQLYISIISIVFRIMVYMVGFYVISGQKLKLNHLGASLKTIFVTPIMIGMFSGMIIYLVQNVTPKLCTADGLYSFLRIDKTLPSVYQTVITFTRLVNPLAMFLIGMTIGEGNVKQVFASKLVWLIALMRNVLAPFVVCVTGAVLHTAGIVHFNEYSFVTLVIAFSAPVSVSLCVYCVQYHKKEQLASQVCMLSTVLSIVTMPLCFVMSYGVLNLII